MVSSDHDSDTTPEMAWHMTDFFWFRIRGSFRHVWLGQMDWEKTKATAWLTPKDFLRIPWQNHDSCSMNIELEAWSWMGTFASRLLPSILTPFSHNQRPVEPMGNVPGFLMPAASSIQVVAQVFEYHFGTTVTFSDKPSTHTHWHYLSALTLYLLLLFFLPPPPQLWGLTFLGSTIFGGLGEKRFQCFCWLGVECTLSCLALSPEF